MTGVEGQWDFYINLRLKIKHRLPLVQVELFTPSHTDTKSMLPLPVCHKSQC